MNSPLLIFLTAISLASPSFAEDVRSQHFFGPCEAFASSGQGEDLPVRLIAFLEAALNESSLWEHGNRESWLQALAQGDLANPFHSGAGVNARLMSRTFEYLIYRPDLNIERLSAWAIARLSEIQEEASVQSTVRHRTLDMARTMEFAELGRTVGEHGLFDPRFKKYEFDWKNWTVQLMTTPVTQFQWVSLMASNPSTSQRDGAELNIVNTKITLNPDHPVESMTLYEVIEFLKKLNNEKQSVEHLRALIPDHRQGDVYTVPNNSLWNWIQTKATPHSFTQNTSKNFPPAQDYIWHSENSGGRAQPVAELNPFELAGQNIFDLYGLVQILLVDDWNPTALELYMAQVTGISFKMQESKILDGNLHLHTPYVRSLPPSWEDSDLGLRLIRIRRGGAK